MANRTITTTLKLNVADFKLQARQAASSLEDLVKKGDKTGQLASTSMGRMAQTLQFQRGAWDTASNAMLGWGAAGVAAVGMVVAKYATFDQAMSNVQASTHESAENMVLLRDAAIKAGADTQYSATEAAGAIEELAKAGISTADILGGGLDGALSLAAAGGLDVAEAAGIASVALTQFKLAGSDVGHVADLLAAGAGKAMGDVQDLGMALKQSGLVASQTGLTLEETTGGLSAFAAAGLLGSDAGISFKSMLQRLTPQSKEAKNLMDDLGISAYDTQGNFVGLSAFAGNLQESLAGLTVEQRNSAMATMFGSDAVRAAAVIYDLGADGVQEWIDKVNDSGYAAETAAARMDNLLGDWEAFTGSLESLFLESGSGVNEILRGMVQGAESLVDVLAEIPTPVLEAGLGLMGFVAIGGLVVGGSMKMIGATYDTIKALQELKTLAPGVSGALGGVGKAAGIAGAALAGLAVSDTIINFFKASPPEIEKTTAALLEYRNAGDGLDEIFAGIAQDTQVGWTSFNDLEGAINRLVNPSVMDRLNDFAGTVSSFGRRDGSPVADGIIKQFDAMGDSLANLVSSGNADQAAQIYDQLAEKWTAAGGSIEALNRHMPAYQEALTGVENKSELAADSTDQFTSASLAAADAAQAQKDAVLDLMDALSQNAGSVLSARDAERDLIATVAESNATIAENGQTLDMSTEAGRANQAAVDAVAKAGWDLVDSMIAATDANGNAVYSTEEVDAAMQSARDEFVKAAIAAGYEAGEAEVLADKLGLIPGTYTATIQAVDKASSVLEWIRLGIENLPTDRSITVRTNYVETHQSVNLGSVLKLPGTYEGGGVPGLAAGGWVPGQRAGHDNVLWPLQSSMGLLAQPLEGHEFVVNSRSAARYGPLLEAINSGQMARGLYSGGSVGRSIPIPVPASVGAAPTVGDLYVTVTNPFTGEEIEQKVDGRLLVAKRRSGR